MDDVDETDEREELFYNNVREKIVSYNYYKYLPRSTKTWLI